jgi:hypothetical protein
MGRTKYLSVRRSHMSKTKKPEQWSVHSFGNFDSFEIHPAGDGHGTTILAKIDEECAGTPKERESRANQIAALPGLLAFTEAFLRTPIAGKGSEKLLLGMARAALAKTKGAACDKAGAPYHQNP